MPRLLKRPNFDARAALLIGALTLIAWFATGCANLSAEQNKSDAAHAVHVLTVDTPADIEQQRQAERAAIIGDLKASAGTATQAAADHMHTAAEWWEAHHRPGMSEHLETARRRFWKEAQATAQEAVR